MKLFMSSTIAFPGGSSLSHVLASGTIFARAFRTCRFAHLEGILTHCAIAGLALPTKIADAPGTHALEALHEPGPVAPLTLPVKNLGLGLEGLHPQHAA